MTLLFHSHLDREAYIEIKIRCEKDQESQRPRDFKRDAKRPRDAKNQETSGSEILICDPQCHTELWR